MPVVRRVRPRSEKDSANDAFPDAHETPLDRIDVNTAEIISILSNSPSESVVFAPKRMETARIQNGSGAHATEESQSEKVKSPI